MNILWNLIFAGVIGLCLLVCPADLCSQERSPSEQLDFAEGVIVLEDGRVFSGTISNVAGGYRVDWNGTYAIVPFGKVDVTAPTLHQAYLALRDRMLKPKADDHLRLAEWCLANQLIGQARSEVSRALNLEPLRPESRALMAKIDEKLNPATESVTVPTQAAMTIDGFLRQDERTSGGLTRETHQEFIRQVQPLLLNKCGNAYCHGEATKTSFRLEPIRRGRSGNRLQSDGNLDQVLKQIDQSSPAKSSLLVKVSANDTAHRDVFRGSKGTEQYQIIANWVASVSGKPLVPNHPVTQSQVVQAGGNRNGSEQSVQLTNGEPTEQRMRRSFDEKKLLEEIRTESQPDPFDPEVFNRRVHGATARKLREQQAEPQSAPVEVKPITSPFGETFNNE